MDDKLAVLALLIAVMVAALMVHLLGMIAGGMITGEKVKEVRIGAGPRLLSRPTRTFGEVSLCLLFFLGNSVSFKTLKPMGQVMAPFLALTALFAVGVMTLGLGDALQTGKTTLISLGTGLARFSLTDEMASLMEYLGQAGPLASFGAVSAGLAAYNALPLPLFNGYAILSGVFNLARGQADPETDIRSVNKIFLIIGLIVSAMTIILSLVGVARWFFAI